MTPRSKSSWHNLKVLLEENTQPQASQGALRKKQSNRQDSRPWPDQDEVAQRSQWVEGQRVRNWDKWQEGTENHAARVPWAKDCSAVNSPCIPGPRTEVSQHVEPRTHGPSTSKGQTCQQELGRQQEAQAGLWKERQGVMGRSLTRESWGKAPGPQEGWAQHSLHTRFLHLHYQRAFIKTKQNTYLDRIPFSLSSAFKIRFSFLTGLTHNLLEKYQH